MAGGGQELPIRPPDPAKNAAAIDEAAASDSGRSDETDLLQLVEYGCWFVLLLAPFLYWVNGPAVSTDQLLVRSVLVGVALGAAAALRLAKLSDRSRRTQPGSESGRRSPE